MKPLIIVFAIALAATSNMGIAHAGWPCSFAARHDSSRVTPPVTVLGYSVTLTGLLYPTKALLGKRLQVAAVMAGLGLGLWDTEKKTVCGL
jgi:hypothetical protein